MFYLVPVKRSRTMFTYGYGWMSTAKQRFEVFNGRFKQKINILEVYNYKY